MYISRRWLSVLLVLILLVIGLPLKALSASDTPIVLSVAVPEYMSDTFTPELFADFESANPGIKVNIVKSGQEANYPPAAIGIDEHLKGAAKYAASADVLYVTNYELSPQVTHAGYFLNLASFTQADKTFSADDFTPAAFRAFQWDGGVWGLPVSTDVTLLVYDAAAFDKANVPHPDAKWTINDLSDAVTRLTQKDSDGKVKLPGMMLYDTKTLIYALGGEKFYDDSVQPAIPKFATPTYTALLDALVKLYQNGSLSGYGNDAEKVPLRFEGTFAMSNLVVGQPVMSGSPLPGGKALLNVYGFAVSQGTQHADQAYALTKFLTNSVKVSSRFFGGRPARKSLMDVKTTDTPFVPFKFTPEVQAFIDQAFANAISPSDVLFGDYVSRALEKMQSDKIDAQTALQAQETAALKDLQTADTHKGTQIVEVATPVPTPVLGAGQVSIHFNLQANTSPLPNKDAWDKVVQDFIASDSQVKQIVFDAGFSGNGKPTDKFDCFFSPYNQVPFADLKDYLSLDSYLDTDTSFAKDDVLSGVLSQLQKDNKTYGYPLVVQPSTLFYNADMFSKANAPIPSNDWTLDRFVDTLKALKPSGSDPEPFATRDSPGAAISMLIAAYGGLPIDPRTDPPTISFTDATNSAAIRQVLDLAKKGYLKYSALAANGSYGGGDNAPIYSASLDAVSYRSFAPSGSAYKDPYKVVSFPRGSKFNVVVYSVGAAYISAKAAHPEACYRWFQTLAKHMELFSTMPARTSQLADPTLATTQGADLIAYYKDVDALLKDPKTVVLPGGFNGSSISGYLTQYLLYRAFDHYVLKDADLDKELADAQTYAVAYQGCVVSIPSINSSDNPAAYYKQFTDCAVKIDPSLKSLFGPN